MLVILAAGPSVAHDIPNARVDRSIQATLSTGRLRVDYEVGLADLTVAQDLRQLGEEIPAGDRRGLFEAYGRRVGPLNAKGLVVAVDGAEVDLRQVGFDLREEGHPLFTFHFEAEVRPSGRLTLVDTNYETGEGTSRLAIRAIDGVAARGDSLPTDVSQIPIRPVWQLGDSEERRTRRLAVDYGPTTAPGGKSPSPARSSVPDSRPATSGLSRLLDGAGGRAWPALLLASVLLGMGHAIQPGHGKTLVAAAALGPGGGPFRGAALGLVTATAHLASVALIALGVWATRAARLGEVHQALARLAGFAIAAVGAWRLGRHLAGFADHDGPGPGRAASGRGLLALGVAGGIVPCWDAVALLVVAAAIDRLGLGLALLAGFSLGMAAVLVAVGATAGRFRAALAPSEGRDRWERRFGIAGGAILMVIGLALLGS